MWGETQILISQETQILKGRSVDVEGGADSGRRNAASEKGKAESVQQQEAS